MSQDNFIRTALRVPPELHAALHKAADQAGRSFNAEIIERLKRSFEANSSTDGSASDQLASSRAQTITAMAFLQDSLCETVAAMYAQLSIKDQRNRTFTSAERLANSLLIGARPGDYLLSRTELITGNPSLARFMDEVEVDRLAYEKKMRPKMDARARSASTRRPT
jgi:hypothetical protein